MTDKIEKEDNDNECWEAPQCCLGAWWSLFWKTYVIYNVFSLLMAFFWPTLGAQIEARMILEL
jgi:hypothetical protein